MQSRTSRPRAYAALLLASAIGASAAAGCVSPWANTYDITTYGITAAGSGPLASGPLVEDGGFLIEGGMASGLVPYSSEPSAEEPPATVVAATHAHMRLAFGLADGVEMGIVGSYSAARWARPLSPAVQAADVETTGGIESLAMQFRTDFTPSQSYSIGLALGGGFRAAMFDRTVVERDVNQPDDAIVDRGKRPRGWLQGGFFAGAPVAGPLWLGCTMTLENVSVASGERTARRDTARQAARSVERFTTHAIFTPSLDFELRFGAFAVGASLFSSVNGNREVPALPIGGRFALRALVGGSGGDPAPMPPVEPVASAR